MHECNVWPRTELQRLYSILRIQLIAVHYLNLIHSLLYVSMLLSLHACNRYALLHTCLSVCLSPASLQLYCSDEPQLLDLHLQFGSTRKCWVESSETIKTNQVSEDKIFFRRGKKRVKLRWRVMWYFRIWQGCCRAAGGGGWGEFPDHHHDLLSHNPSGRQRLHGHTPRWQICLLAEHSVTTWHFKCSD